MSKRLRRLHVDDGLDLLWVALDSSLRDEVAQQLACRHSKGALLRVELDAVAVEVAKVSRRSSSRLSAFVDLMMMPST
jgi:hypothetical protein